MIRPIRRRNSCGRFFAMLSITSRCISTALPTMRATSTSRCAGASAGTTVRSKHGKPPAGIWHQNDDVLILSLKTKMHVIGPGVIAGLAKAREEAEKNYKGLVIWSADAAEGGAFSAGADLQSMLPLFMSGGVKAIEPEVAR